MAAVIEPLDPDSDKGREVAARLNQVLAEIRAELVAKRAAEKALAGQTAA